jgi:uncharacterized membrane protein YphA (DoxX/SURF4 family)
VTRWLNATVPPYALDHSQHLPTKGESRALAGIVRDTQTEGWGVTLERMVRMLVGGTMLSTGVMKLVVPKLRSAWGAQLDQADLPLRDVTYQLFPFVEIGIGATLIAGVWPRVGAAAVIGMMSGATYVHVVVDDPDVFPLQPKAPVIPLGMIGLALYILAKSGTPTVTP